jgi:hypothetical protein
MQVSAITGGAQAASDGCMVLLLRSVRVRTRAARVDNVCMVIIEHTVGSVRTRDR